jgi:hypothetical protein
VFVIDEKAGRMWRCRFSGVVRAGESREWYTQDGELTGVDHPDRTLRSTKTVSRVEVGFTLQASRARYDKPGSPDWAVVFAADATSSAP